MGKYCVCFFSLVLPTMLYAQNDYKIFPNNYNSFTGNSAISWGMEFNPNYSFLNSALYQQKNIYDYLIKAKETGKIKSYLNKDWITDDNRKWLVAKNSRNFYAEVNSFFDKQYALKFDSAKRIDFHEILFIENHKLKSLIIAAAPEYPVYTSMGVFIGNTIKSYCCLNKMTDTHNINNTIFFENTYDVYNIDSLESATIIKKTYGMNLALTLWFDLSKGYNEVVDLKSNKRINAKDIMEYSPFDSVEVIIGDDTIAPLTKKVPGAPAKSSFSQIGILQKWYYNISKNIFISTINEVCLYIKNFSEKEPIEENEKRFKIIFK